MFYCLDCGVCGPLTVHGRCSTCDSNAVCFAQAIRPRIDEIVKVNVELARQESWFRRVVDEAANERKENER